MEDKEEREAKPLPYSIVVLVRKDLGMKKGKVAAQTAHAIIGACYKTLDTAITQSFMEQSLERRIVCLRVASEADMLKIQAQMEEMNVNTFIQVDVGLTQVPAYSKTAMAIGPDLTDKIAPLIKHLPLY
jgi:PTH2 family peptidyl-tRNA hydrolase